MFSSARLLYSFMTLGQVLLFVHAGPACYPFQTHVCCQVLHIPYPELSCLKATDQGDQSCLPNETRKCCNKYIEGTAEFGGCEEVHLTPDPSTSPSNLPGSFCTGCDDLSRGSNSFGSKNPLNDLDVEGNVEPETKQVDNPKPVVSPGDDDDDPAPQSEPVVPWMQDYF